MAWPLLPVEASGRGLKSAWLVTLYVLFPPQPLFLLVLPLLCHRLFKNKFSLSLFLIQVVAEAAAPGGEARGPVGGEAEEEEAWAKEA